MPRDLRSVLVATDRLQVVVAPGHPRAGRTRPLTLEEIAATALVEREPGSGTRIALEAIVEKRLPGVRRAAPVAELNSNGTILASVAAGLGPAVLSELAVREAVERGRVVSVPVAGAPLGRELRAVWYGVREPPGAAGDLLRIARGADVGR